MARLTKWLNNKKALCIEVCEKECTEGFYECHDCDPFTNVLVRLAYYEDMEEKLASAYGECGGLLEKVVEGLVEHEGVEFEKPMKARLLTDDDVDKWDRLKGAMERIEDRLDEAMERQWGYYNKAKGEGNIRQMDYSDGCAEGLTTAIEILNEEMND